MSRERGEFDFKGVCNTGPYKAWENWFRDHDFPVHQVAVTGWATRDEAARTVSAQVYAWRPGEEERFDGSHQATHAYPQLAARPLIAYRYDNKTLTYVNGEATDAWMGVLTIQLDRAPDPFPEID